MKGKTFLMLLVSASVLVALSFLRFGNEEQTGAVKMGDKLFADLPVNQVAGITIADSENRVTLVRGDKLWQVKERNGYPANFNELRNTVVNLSRLKIGRSFSGSPESLVRLSLMPPSASTTSGKGKQMTLTDTSGKILADVILGQTRETDGGGSGGQYLKKADADVVFLVDGNFRFLKTEPAQWLKKEILDVKADNVKSVACFSGDAATPVYTLIRPERGQAAQMTPVPEGRNADSSKIDQILDALAPLTIDDVQPSGGKPPVEGSDQPRLVYDLYDGRQISIFPDAGGKEKESYTLRVTADASKDTVSSDKPEPTSEEGDSREKAGTDPDKDAPVVKTAQQLNMELGPWIFSVKKWQFDNFIILPESLLEEVSQEGKGTS